jgi:SynChlorMet cassette protein ScmD
MEKVPFANPDIVYREDFDDWAILFDPDTADAYGLDEIGSFIWKQIDDKRSVDAIAGRIPDEFDGVPENVGEHVEAFFTDMENNGLIGYQK